MLVKSTHVVVLPGGQIGEKSFDLTLTTSVGSAIYKLDKSSLCFEATGTYGWFPNPFGGWSEALKALWALIKSFGGEMDVVADLDDNILVSFNNPTFGYPYTVFADGVYARRYNYYADEQHVYQYGGKLFKCTRHEDSDNKEFTLEVCV